ncbi:hypothetical protein, partial [Acinetobacter sp. WCHAc060033]|uniref:hypothetical protein n=1 Tax=Acinetobacter sp. WCHAc060033 TaxID=2518624 RepID=UPI001D186807
MKPNISKHPCANKCSNFKDEQCKTCLVRDIEKREFDLGVAPDEAYKAGFKMDDMVVKISGDDNTLYVFAMYSTVHPGYCYIGEPYAEDGEMAHVDEISLASTAEIQANRRLTEAEQAI